MLPRLSTSALAAAIALWLAACVRVPEAEPLQFAVDDAVLREARSAQTLEQVAAALREDPALHLLIIGHADEDNTDEYNRALSQRRAEHARDRLLALDPNFAERLHVEARGEWDASDSGTGEAAKARNRRVELRFFYPRQCEPSFDAEFIACEWARLPEVERVVALAEPPADPEPPQPAEPRPEPGDDPSFRGPYLFAIGGYAISSGEYLRQHARWGLGAGYLWGFGSEFRIAAGVDFDHLVDVGFLFPQPDSCRPDCSAIDRSRIRVVPELRVGGARGGLWGWLRLSAGVAFEHREPNDRWYPGAVVGIGPGVAVTLTRHLFLLLEATVTYVATRGTAGTGWSGAGIYDAGAGLGWVF